MCAWIVSNHPGPDHAPIVIVIQSERLEHSICPRNQFTAKHPDSGCFSISGVVICSALSKGWRSGPEAFCAGHLAWEQALLFGRVKRVSRERASGPSLARSREARFACSQATGHFLRLNRNRKPRMKSLWHPGYIDVISRGNQW